MRPLRYLVATTLKNRLRELVKKPSRIIYTVLLLALLVFVLVGGSHSDGIGMLHGMDELVTIVLAFYTVMFLMTANAGFTRGGNIFSLSDAMFLFTSPIRPQAILFYGLLRQMGTTLLVGFFLLFQYANLHNFYGITVAQMVGLLLAYGCTIFIGQVTAMMLYAFTSNDERMQKLVKAVLNGIYALCAGYVAVRCLTGSLGSAWDRAVEAVSGGFLYAVPVGGWAALLAKGILNGAPVLALLGFGLCAIFTALLVALLFHADPDYYEDVLKSAEISYSAITAKKEGTMQEATPAHIKLGRTGLGGGWGASAFFRKHLLENRRSRKFLLPGNALLFAAIAIGFCLFTKDGGLLPTFIMATYLQLFSAMLTGRFNYELTRPYLYLVPEPALKKLLWALAETLPSMLLDALVVLIPVGLILECSPLTVAAAVAARMSFGIVYLAGDIAVARIWGGGISRVLVMFLYLAVSLVIMAPGIALAVFGGISGGFGTEAVLLLLAAGNLPMSLLMFFLCRNLLQYAELSGQ